MGIIGLSKMKYADPNYKLGGKAGVLLQFSESNNPTFLFFSFAVIGFSFV